jgi:hypothetical protein
VWDRAAEMILLADLHVLRLVHFLALVAITIRFVYVSGLRGPALDPEMSVHLPALTASTRASMPGISSLLFAAMCGAAATL